MGTTQPWDPWHESPMAIGEGKPVTHLQAVHTWSAAIVQDPSPASETEDSKGDTAMEEAKEPEVPEAEGDEEPIYLSTRQMVKELVKEETTFTDSPMRM